MSNYDRAQTLAHDAEMLGQVEDAHISAMNAQTHALLAVADAIGLSRAHIEPSERTYFVLATSEIDALFAYKRDLQFDSRERAEEVYQELGRPVAQSIYRVCVEVVQS